MTHKGDHEFHNLYLTLLMLHTEFGQQKVQHRYKTKEAMKTLQKSEEYGNHASIKYCFRLCQSL